MISNFITVKNADKEFVAYLKIPDEYKNLVENSIKNFEIPTLLSYKQEGNCGSFEKSVIFIHIPSLIKLSNLVLGVL